MRRTAVLLLAALSTAAFGQLSVNEELIQGAMQTLNLDSMMFMRLQGTETINNVANPLFVDTYFQVSLTGPRVLAQVDIVAYATLANGTTTPIKRIVGDGVTLWSYDYVNNQYSAVNYGTYSGQQPANYSSILFKYLSSVAQGYATYPTTTLRQIYGPEGASYQSWMPGTQPGIDGLGNVIYSTGFPPRRTIQFILHDLLQDGSLSAITYSDNSTVGQLKKSVNWSMSIGRLLQIDPSVFYFVPPSGARAIAGPHLSGQ